MDDITNFSKSIDEQIQHVDDIRTTLGEAGITLNLNKCRFFSYFVDYLGHIIKHGPLKIDQSHTESLKDAKQPTNRSVLRSFLGLCKVYRRFIPVFTGIEHPPSKLLRKGGRKTSN